MGREPIVISVCGKGGVGKTSISALMIKTLAKNRDQRILAIDADPSIGLAFSLGVSVTKTIDDVRNRVVEKMTNKSFADKSEVAPFVDYELFEALEEVDNVAFLAVGRPEKEGCYCKVNTALREVIEQVAQNFDYVVIDGEAGVEQVNRRVMERVTHLILVSDLSKKSLRVCETIVSVAKSTVKYKRAGLIVNRVRDGDDLTQLSHQSSIEQIGVLPESDTLREHDRVGASLLEMDEADIDNAISTCLAKLIP